MISKLTGWLVQVRTLKYSAPGWIHNASLSLSIVLARGLPFPSSGRSCMGCDLRGENPWEGFGQLQKGGHIVLILVFAYRRKFRRTQKINKRTDQNHVLVLSAFYLPCQGISACTCATAFPDVYPSARRFGTAFLVVGECDLRDA